MVGAAESPVSRGNPAVQSPEPVPPPHVPGKSVANVKINSAKQTGNLASKRKTRPETTDSDDSEDSTDERYGVCVAFLNTYMSQTILR